MALSYHGRSAHQVCIAALQFADFDGDGRVDAVIHTDRRDAAAPAKYRGRGQSLAGAAADAGARVHIVTASGEQWNHATTSVGYASSSELAVHFGLGKESRVKLIEITWPSGKMRQLENVEADRYMTVQ